LAVSNKEDTMNRPNKLATAARIVLGLVFLLSGLNHLIAFIPMPPLSGAAGQFMQGLQQSRYLFPLMGIVEVGAALLLLSGRMVPLALTVLAPIVINVAAFHLVLAPQGLPIVVVLLAAEGGLAYAYRERFAALFTGAPAAEPAAPPALRPARASR
jgi:putative oxidoreductase